MHLINGKALADKILCDIKNQIEQNDIKSGLAIILVGNDPASKIYVRLKQKTCENLGIDCHVYLFADDAKQEKIVEAINFLNEDQAVKGILVQLPLPTGFDETKILNTIAPAKDVDALTSAPLVISPLAQSIAELIKSTSERLTTKKFVVLANHSAICASLKTLFPENQIEYISPTTVAWQEKTKTADILIACVGKINTITADKIKQGAIIIDVGINKAPDGATTGDVDAQSVENIASWLTPVPGGVGPMTIAMLLKNLLALSNKNN
ncbi:bifunctional 5,10-methylene-tetrahydrofolate dehydrogenase/5,10-methylene-tetrahydrofolate cyclohydrolase [Candidatus Falkowbacteria bacterium]|nr:bifunctional 5,10-methylene-tetrahydrofolate dehydrogenase/5,10-methylene-tetrahydrofolate cyclohydrolase [Candidatus Falkowbacteria bacterium]